MDISQEQLAEHVGVTRKTINSVERGHFVPSTILALKIARVFRVFVEEVFSLAKETQASAPSGSLSRTSHSRRSRW